MNRFSVTFIFGAVSETESLRKTILGILENSSKDDLDKIIIVQSKNITRECKSVVDEMATIYNRYILVINQDKPYIGGAIQDGVDNVTSSHFTVFPSDLAIGFESIPAMIETAKRNPNVIVKTSRWLKSDSFHNYSSFRKFFNRLAQGFLRFLFQSKLTDLTNPVQIMPTELYRSIKWREYNYPVLIEMVLCPLRLGIDFFEVPTACYGRTEGKSGNSFLQTALYLKTALRIRFSKTEHLLRQNVKFEIGIKDEHCRD